jgi:hypothetical protein
MRTGFTNRPGIEYDEDKLDRFFAEDMQAVADFINGYLTIFGDFIKALVFEHDTNPTTDLIIRNKCSDKDLLLYINDGGVDRLALKIKGTEGTLDFPRQSAVGWYTTVAQSIPNSTMTVVNSTNAEFFDVLGECSAGVFTAKVAGRYEIDASIIWPNVIASVYYSLAIFVNGSQRWAKYNSPASNASYLTLDNHFEVTLAVGDTVDMRAYQTSGVNKSLVQYENSFFIKKVA